jgi:uncharacterized protein (TIGR03663 family)
LQRVNKYHQLATSMSKRLCIYATWVGIILLSLALRLPNLGNRPIHADEATGARILSNQLQGDTYTFNPQHFHGPLLSLTSAPLARMRGESNWSELTKSTLRLGPVIAGLLLVLVPLLWLRQIGQLGALTAAALLASSPLLVYYNRMYIHESLLALFALLAATAIHRLTISPTKRMGVLAGLSIGLMFATKETFAISILSWLPAAALCCWLQNQHAAPRALLLKTQSYLAPALPLTLTAAVTAIYFYSDGLRQPQGMVDAVRTYFVYETTEGHEKGGGYYLHLMLWPKQALGIWWSEAVVAILAVIACAATYLNPARLSAVLFLASATIGHFVIYSLIGYKTPWLMLVPWAHACLLAGCALNSIHRLKPATRVLLTALILGGLAYQTKQSIAASGRFASDARNPYAYVPTSKDMETLQTWLDQLEAELPDRTLNPIAVVGSEYWPLPWYLRNSDTIGYWPEPTHEMQSHPIVLAMPGQTAATDTLLQHSHARLPRGLRANVPVILYLRNDIWNTWTQPLKE